MGELVTNTPIDYHQLVLKIERHQSMLHNFAEKLGSYTCEPTDYQCFTQVSDLKYNIRELLEDQQGVLSAIRNKVNDSNLVKAINELFERFGRIEQQMAAYLIATNPYQ